MEVIIKQKDFTKLKSVASTSWRFFKSCTRSGTKKIELIKKGLEWQRGLVERIEVAQKSIETTQGTLSWFNWAVEGLESHRKSWIGTIELWKDWNHTGRVGSIELWKDWNHTGSVELELIGITQEALSWNWLQSHRKSWVGSIELWKDCDPSGRVELELIGITQEELSWFNWALDWLEPYRKSRVDSNELSNLIRLTHVERVLLFGPQLRIDLHQEIFVSLGKNPLYQVEDSLCLDVGAGFGREVAQSGLKVCKTSPRTFYEKSNLFSHSPSHLITSNANSVTTKERSILSRSTVVIVVPYLTTKWRSNSNTVVLSSYLAFVPLDLAAISGGWIIQ